MPFTGCVKVVGRNKEGKFITVSPCNCCKEVINNDEKLYSHIENTFKMITNLSGISIIEIVELSDPTGKYKISCAICAQCELLIPINIL